MLDCETEKGKRFINEQHATQKALEKYGFVFINTFPLNHGLDAIIAKKNGPILEMAGLAEIKSRMMAGGVPLTVRYLSENGGYLVTHSKIKFGVDLAYQFGVPFFLIVRLLSEGLILIWKLSDNNGQYLFDFITKGTETQSTCNGGSTVRINAYLPVEKAKIIEFK